MSGSGKMIVIGVRSSDEDARPGARQRECHAKILARFAAKTIGAKVYEGSKSIVVMTGPEPGDRAKMREAVWKRASGQGRVTDAEMDRSVDTMLKMYEDSGCGAMGWKALVEELINNFQDVDVFDTEGE